MEGGRRRWPLAVLVVGSVAYWAIATFASPMASLLSTQIAYFLVVLGGVAWARNRRAMALVYSVIIFAMGLWLIWGIAVGQVLSDMVEASDPDAWVPATIAAPLMLGAINVLYFGGAVLGGQVLQSFVVEGDIPVLGHVKLVSSLFFDIGVFLVVIGLVGYAFEVF